MIKLQGIPVLGDGSEDCFQADRFQALFLKKSQKAVRLFLGKVSHHHHLIPEISSQVKAGIRREAGNAKEIAQRVEELRRFHFADGNAGSSEIPLDHAVAVVSCKIIEKDLRFCIHIMLLCPSCPGGEYFFLLQKLLPVFRWSYMELLLEQPGEFINVLEAAAFGYLINIQVRIGQKF